MGKLTNLNPITEANLPPEMTRDSELAALLLTAMTVGGRSGPVGVNANSCMTDKASGFMWLDDNGLHTNLPRPWGLLVQGDPLFYAAEKGLYRYQAFLQGGTASTTALFLRHQTNGTWASWRSI
jgi:hypothetical protein